MHMAMAEARSSPAMQPDSAAPAEEELQRAGLYRVIARLLLAPPDAALLARLAAFGGTDTPLGRTLADLGQAAAMTDAAVAGTEYHDLFIGLTRGELLPYGSYYLTGFLHEKPLAELRGSLAALGIARAPGVSEPEDHAGSLCEVMAGLIDGAYGEPR